MRIPFIGIHLRTTNRQFFQIEFADGSFYTVFLHIRFSVSRNDEYKALVSLENGGR